MMMMTTFTQIKRNLWDPLQILRLQLKQQHAFKPPSILICLQREDRKLLITEMNMEQHELIMMSSKLHQGYSTTTML
uniref:Uncharacterized protein n=1 Tax=Arundo donax TaxID=35708 RepID=A0A0A9CKC4_ARUDO